MHTTRSRITTMIMMAPIVAASTLVQVGEGSTGNKPPAPQVDFSYAFATPHRLTVAVKAVPTHFGPLSYEINSDVDHQRISANLDLPARNAPQSVLLKLRHPQAAPIKSVTVNGQAWKAFDAAGAVVRLDKLTGKVQVVATY